MFEANNNPMPNTQLRSAFAPQLLLLVDADEDTRDLYRMFLVPRRYIVEQAGDGREALAKAISTPPDVIVTETRLPGIDGLALCELLRRDPATRSATMVVLTSDSRPHVADSARDRGADEVIVKPCLPKALWQTLEGLRKRGPCTRPSREVADPPALRRRAKQRQHFETTTPPASPPDLRCALCDAPLTYERSHVGGVTANFSEQWDDYRCPRGCGAFQYRHRTRRVRRLVA
jgi:CheY-like chemotaxis protein